MRNVELKFELRDPEHAARVCRELGASHVGVMHQIDTYYRVPGGRLKRRECAGRADEWIVYCRADQESAKLSEYTIHGREDVEASFQVSTLPVWVVVEKQRDLWLIGAVRIHLDDVADLGRFFELEAPAGPGQDVARCHHLVEWLRSVFAPLLGRPIAGGYSDLLAATLG